MTASPPPAVRICLLRMLAPAAVVHGAGRKPSPDPKRALLRQASPFAGSTEVACATSIG